MFIKARENPYNSQIPLFGADTPLLPGGTVDIKHARHLTPQNSNIFKAALQAEVHEETHGHYQSISNINNPFSTSYNQKEQMFFYKIRVQEARKQLSNCETKASKETERLFLLNIVGIKGNLFASASI